MSSFLILYLLATAVERILVLKNKSGVSFIMGCTSTEKESNVPCLANHHSLHVFGFDLDDFPGKIGNHSAASGGQVGTSLG